MIGIYKITNPEGKIYIGQSTNIEKRKTNYRLGNCKGQIKIYRSIIKYGWDKHEFKVIKECEYTSLNELEAYYILLFDSTNRDIGMNLKTGGAKPKLCQESIDKMATTLRKRYIDNPELKNKMSEMGAKSAEKTRGVKKSREHIDKILRTKAINGTMASKPSTISKMAETVRKKFSENPEMRLRMIAINKLASCNKKKVRCILTDRVWNSCKEMCEEMGLNVKYTCKQLSGSRTNFTTYEYIRK